MSFRSPLLGYNHNLKYKGRIFHIQTEDSGENNPHIFTHLFHNGIIISTKMKKYDALLSKNNVKEENVDTYVRKLMQLQHKDMMKNLIKGTFDNKIKQFFGSLEPSDAETSGETSTGNQAKPAKNQNINLKNSNFPPSDISQNNLATENPGKNSLESSQPDHEFGGKIPTLPGHNHPSSHPENKKIPGKTTKSAKTNKRNAGDNPAKTDKNRPETRTEGLLSLSRRSEQKRKNNKSKPEADEDFPVTIETVSTYFFQEKEDTLIDSMDWMNEDLDYDLSAENEEPAENLQQNTNEAEEFFSDIKTDPGQNSSKSESLSSSKQNSEEKEEEEKPPVVVVSRPAIVLTGDDSNFGSFSNHRHSSSSLDIFNNQQSNSSPDPEEKQEDLSDLENFTTGDSILTETSGLFKPEESESVPDDIVSGENQDNQSIDDIILDFLKKQSDLDPEDQ
ncbi:MAG: hypothetical protein PF689_08835 [Deltaproteobacteria bacterium]|jgi:hypothetical protein|nr:hypothetical protein [Deltaproteobacteria bacterium]